VAVGLGQDECRVVWSYDHAIGRLPDHREMVLDLFLAPHADDHCDEHKLHEPVTGMDGGHLHRDFFPQDGTLCWLLMTSVQKNREMCQEHHEGTTLSYWLHEPSTEKNGSELFRNLLLCCFFGEKSEVMKRFCFDAGSVLPGKDTDALLVVVIRETRGTGLRVYNFPDEAHAITWSPPLLRTPLSGQALLR
jgi:hypothetical protein